MFDTQHIQPSYRRDTFGILFAVDGTAVAFGRTRCRTEFTKKSYDEFESKMCVVSPRGRYSNGAMMSVDGPAIPVSEAMPRRRVSSHQAPNPQSVGKMKARQSAKIREIADALICAGFPTIDAQAKILGVGRSTAWTLLKSTHKGSGLSAKVISRILAVRQLPRLSNEGS